MQKKERRKKKNYTFDLDNVSTQNELLKRYQLTTKETSIIYWIKLLQILFKYQKDYHHHRKNAIPYFDSSPQVENRNLPYDLCKMKVSSWRIQRLPVSLQFDFSSESNDDIGRQHFIFKNIMKSSNNPRNISTCVLQKRKITSYDEKKTNRMQKNFSWYLNCFHDGHTYLLTLSKIKDRECNTERNQITGLRSSKYYFNIHHSVEENSRNWSEQIHDTREEKKKHQYYILI